MEISSLPGSTLSGNQQLAEEDLVLVDIEESLGAATASLRQAYPGRRIESEICVMPALTVAHPALLEQVLHNIVENAIKYSDDDSVVQINVFEEGDMIAVETSDNGCGIAPDDLPYIFERFYRSDTSQVGHGHGLGLSIAKTFVDTMGGSIQANSPGRDGAITTIAIRLVRAEDGDWEDINENSPDR